MLHALPALLHDLEAKLIAGEDPLPLLATVRWQELIGWPADLEGAQALRRRVQNLQNLVSSLEAPLRATLMKLGDGGTYAPRGGVPLPATLSVRIQQHV
ncbi:hypothetical protein [Mesoterricola sediminis]|uniref:Uncharacterized protein n=1 Tax=Mesoterricola sediminis TaxID=2927980 RepID=A0AA48KCL1_9BACT|nr:hypothetical protein [Mesoterricola sediminis]BDU77196.1 hypothetical protein METESE_21540 [Mesoterricola sediminis]